jgi:8-amino-7-oxononanoate synthase
MNEPESWQQVGRTRVRYRGRELSYFAGCDYFRLASHPAILRAVAVGMKKYGLNVAASRVTTGNHKLYLELEAALARFFGAPAALVVSNGYATNSIVAQALRGEVSHVIIDAKSHVSLRDAARYFACPVLEFKHRDVADLRRQVLRAGRTSRPILLTDGVFTYEGEIPPLPDYLKILGPRGLMLVDDAHGAGVIGRTGRGALEFTEAPRDRVIQSITLSKAFGVYGGAVLCSREFRGKMRTRSAMFAGSTPLPLPLAYAGLQAVALLRRDAGFLRRLNQNARHVKSALGLAQGTVPVISVNPKNPAHAAALRKRLMEHGVFPSFIKYPGGPEAGYLRLVISSEHTRKQLEDLIAAVRCDYAVQ